MSSLSAPAWQERDWQRQQFTERMLKKIREAEDAQDDNGYFNEDLLLAFIMLIAERMSGGDVSRYREFYKRHTITTKMLMREIVAEAEFFGRAPEEATYVLQKIVDSLMQSFSGRSHIALLKKQLFETRTILGVDCATDEVEVSED